MTFTSKDGLCKSADISFVETWNKVVDKQNVDRAEWIAYLRKNGVKASHPDDGWVNRNINQVTFSYPQFDDGVSVGDYIALGWEWKWRLVKVIALPERPQVWIGRYTAYLFEETKPLKKVKCLA